MVGNTQADISGDILVEFDYNNIIVVDPNKTIDGQRRIKERLVDHENLVMYVNLEADVLPRTKLAVGGSPKDRLQTISVQKMNFLKPTKDTFLSTGYVDELTGQNTTQFQGTNQPKVVVNTDSQGQIYNRNTVVDQQNVYDTGLLGITSVEVTTNTAFIPTVRIQLEDVQGKALFQLGDNSPYSAFFNLPHPQFYLTLKGYYGQAIRYQLNLEKFNCSFNSFSGNYQVNLEFKGYKFNILNEISLAHLLATPHMYSQTYNISTDPVTLQTNSTETQLYAKTENQFAAAASNSSDNIVTEITSERGYQKIREVYSEYKSKGLIPADLPELTLLQLMNKLEFFENSIINSYPKANLEPLTNINTYKATLSRYYDAVRGSSVSWFNKNLNPNPIVLRDDTRVYVFKSNLNQGAIESAITELKSIIKDFNAELASNPTLGVKGPTKIVNDISYDNMVVSDNFEAVDWEKTSNLQTGSPDNVAEVKRTYDSVYKFTFETTTNGELVLVKKNAFVFDTPNGPNRFNKLITSMEAEANKKLADYETAISNDLANRLQDSATGLGFKPTVRNMIGVIMASAEAFIRLMDDVHTNAWDVKYDPVRKQAILENAASAQGSDTKDNFNISLQSSETADGLNNGKIPVYPWPQFFVETNEDKKGRFQIKYLADPALVDQTQGFLYKVWPEVEFIEEYIKGLTQKFNPPVVQPPLDNGSSTPIININAIEFPVAGIAYSNKQELKYFYEIWERQFVTAYYNNFSRIRGGQIDQITNLNVEVESSNIVQSINISAPYLSMNLKNFDFNASNYEEFLQNISNGGTGKAYQDFIRDFFVTPYIKNITENSFSILNTTEIGKIPTLSTQSQALEQIAQGDNNTPLIIDTLPFTDPSWVSSNMVDSEKNSGNLVYETKNTLQVFPARNVLANFSDLFNYTDNRPVIDFNYLTTALVEPSSNFDFETFYISKMVFPNKLYPTEGFYYGLKNDPLKVGTTSILNTPYFINAIQNGVYNQRRGDAYPYVQAAYLFINSLPLATLREKYKSFSNNATIDKDYIASVFKKYGAIHKMPYAWVVKIGSIWHRYKNYIETGEDILDTAWKNFDYVDNYSPKQHLTSQKYEFEYNQTPTSIVLQDENSYSFNLDVGFYPKVITDFNYFYKGYDLFSDFTSAEVQDAVNSGMKIITNGNSQIFGVSFVNKSINETTRSVLIPKDNVLTPSSECNPVNNTVGDEYYIVPSFGTTYNQSLFECVTDFTSNPSATVDMYNNPGVFNGSVRMFWGASNYGYFNADSQKKPKPDEYINKFDSNKNISGFKFSLDGEYSKIEELFSVFEKTILDQFEDVFLKFCVTSTQFSDSPVTIQLYQNPVNINSNYKNFQSLMKSLMTVPAQQKDTGPVPSLTDNSYLQDTILAQLGRFNNLIRGFLEYDVILKYGNPSNYNRRVFDSYRSYLSPTQYVVNPITFDPYIKGSLPTKSDPMLLSVSKAQNPDAWKTLELEVGFSTIKGVEYSSNGSFITDFFPDNNIEFNSQNIKLLAPLIKMYATQKQKNNLLTQQRFKEQIGGYLQENKLLQDLFINNTLSKVRATLPNQQQLPERRIQPVLDGQQTKTELYEMFKALNDKWIAGGDFDEKTLFEDILFLDRASRNIGDTILIDIFSLKNILNQSSINEKMSVYGFISEILITNNFTVMNLPAYVNFYNVQDVSRNAVPQPEGSLEFANRLWGTFLDVDYRNSSPKMVCFYVGKPSEYLAMTNADFRFRSDAFDMSRASELPLLENQDNKTDWALSNKCVGFSVDIGIRNQNIFYAFQVAQEQGKATSESVNMVINMVDQGTGRNTATQNVSLYNLYKNRSYTCTISCLGNALIQPTMYFNLRHVPMFYGPYLITDVSHSIQPGNFQTTFTGVRQNIFDLPAIDNFLQQVNQNLLTKIQELVKTKKDTPAIPATSDNQKAQNTSQNSNNQKAAENSCSSSLNPFYVENKYESTNAVSNPPLSPGDLTKVLTDSVTNPKLRLLIYSICYLKTFREESNSEIGSFYGYNNNFAILSLENNFTDLAKSYFQNTYSCVEVDQKTSVPIANFENLNKFIDFMASRLSTWTDAALSMGIDRYYTCYWPVDNVSYQYFDANPNEFSEVRQKTLKSIYSALSVGLLNKQEAAQLGIIIEENSVPPNVTPTPSPLVVGTCPPPIINSFSPSTAATNRIVQLNGYNLLTTSGITIANVEVDMSLTEIFDDQTLRFTVPDFPDPTIQAGKVGVRTKFGNATSDKDFKHI